MWREAKDWGHTVDKIPESKEHHAELSREVRGCGCVWREFVEEG